MPEEILQEGNPIYKYLKSKNLTDLDENQFVTKYSAPEKAKEIYSYLVSQNLTDLDETNFYDKYLKKKDQEVSPFVSSSAQSLSPDFEKGKAFAEKGFLMKPEGTKEQKRISVEPSLTSAIFGGAPKVKILEEITENEILNKFKLEARDFVIKERLDKLKNNFIIEKTPLGNVIMFWDNFRGSFVYYSDNTIPYRYLETVSRKYVKTFNCRQIYFDMEFELFEFERKQKDRQESDMKLLEDKKKMELEQNTSFNSNLGLVEKKNVFAKFKNYNKESGTGRVNRGVAPPKNSIPNNNNMKNTDENVVLKENANRYTYEGRLSNFSFLKKTDRKVIDKKYAMSFADFKKNMLHK